MGRIRKAWVQANQKRVVFVAVVLGILLLLGVFGYTQYRQLFPSISKFQQPSPLDGISIYSENYSDMTAQQRDLQLKRQIGISVSELKKTNIHKSTFKNYYDAYRAAHALWSEGSHDSSLAAYAAADGFKDDKKTYRFHLDYAYVAVQKSQKQTAQQQLAKAKPGIDAEQTERTKSEASSTYEYLTVLAERL